jgi:outer membrane protein TolC
VYSLQSIKPRASLSAPAAPEKAMTWKALAIGLPFALAAVIGCQNQFFLTAQDLQNAKGICLPPISDGERGAPIAPPGGLVPPPTTVDDTQRQVRYMSLREAISIALENGTIGGQSAAVPGIATDGLGGFGGGAVTSADSIRVLALDPAITETNIEISLSKFDVVWNNSVIWNHTEIPTGTGPVLVGGGVPAVFSSTETDNVSLSTGLVKPLPTGGVAGITFTTTYTQTDPRSAINPAYQPDLQFVFEQPLLQGFGVEINQLRDTHPGSLLLPFATGGQAEGVLITRLRFDQERTEFERQVTFLLLNVEGAYWNLYGAYYQLYSREEGMRYAFEAWRLTKLGLEQGGRAAAQDLAQARLQYEQFRGQRLTALGQVLESERQLRNLLQLRIEDGTRIVPSDAPTLTPVKPDWQTALNEALAQRPELILARQDLRFHQLNLIKVKNSLLPDLRFIASDDIHSIGTQLDGGSTPDNAFHQLFSDPLNNFSLGLRMNVPLGFRAAHATVRAARLNLERSYLSLQTDENKAELFLGLAYRQVLEFQQQIEIQQAALDAATTQLRRIYDLFRLGRSKPYGADLILALENWTNSVSGVYSAIVQYNNSLATFEFAKGSMLAHDNIYITEGPLPQCAKVRAVVHERQRTLAKVLKDCGPPIQPVRLGDGAVPIMNSTVARQPMTLPQLQRSQAPLPRMPPADGDQATGAALPEAAGAAQSAAETASLPLPQK